jgi:CHAT domain-containing protein
VRECVVSDTDVRSAIDRSNTRADAGGMRPRFVLVLAVGMLIGAAAMAVWSGRLMRPIVASLTGSRAEGLTELVAAVDAERRRGVQGRLTGGFRHAPRPATMRAAGDAAPPRVSTDVRLAAAKAEAAAARSGTPETLAVNGVASLVLGDVERAIASLERAASVHTPAADQAAAIQSDLAAAYLARAEDSNRAEDGARALAAAERAVRGAPDSREAAFNRALTLQYLGLIAPARTAWRAYMAMETDPAWRGEAQAILARAPFTRPAPSTSDVIAHLRDALDRRDTGGVARLCTEHPFIARRFVEEDLLAEWADAWLRGDTSRAAARLAAAGMLASAVHTRMHDDVAVRAAARLGEVVARGDRAAARALAEGHRAYLAARQFDGKGAQSDALRGYQDSLRQFTRGRSSMADWARFWIGVFESRNGEPDRSAATLEQAIVRAGDGARALRGRARYVQGLVRYTQGRYEAALVNLSESLTALEATGEIEFAAEARTALAEAFDVMGQADRAWQFRLRSLRDQSFMRSERDRHLVLIDAVRAALAHDLPEASLAFAEEAEANARAWGHPGSFLEVEVARADAWRHMRRLDEALDAIARAKDFLARLPDQTLAERWDHLIAGAEARILVLKAPDRAVLAAERGIATLSRLGMTSEQPPLYGVAASAQIALQRLPDAEAALQQGIDIIERERLRLPDRELRVTAFDAAYDLYLERAELLGRLQRWDACFLTLERARSTSMLSPRTQPVGIDDLRRSLPGDITVVYLALLKTRAVAWTIDRERAQVVELAGDPASLVAIARQLREALDARVPAEVARLSEVASAALVAPLASALASASDRGSHSAPNGGRPRALVIVPDDVLGLVPFSLLRNPRTGRRLVEDHVVSVAPNATWLRAALLNRQRAALSASTRTPGASSAGASGASGASGALFVAASTDPTGSLNTLAAASREIAESSRRYSGARVLVDEQATPEAVLSHLPSAAMVHIASHAITSREHPWLSRLALSANADGRSELFMYEIAGLTMRTDALVILSACDTASGSVSRSAGVLGLTFGFLAAGARSVIGTLWRVDDGDAAALMTAFHRHYAIDRDAVLALRAAQLQALAATDSYEWAAFQAVGVSAGAP